MMKFWEGEDEDEGEWREMFLLSVYRETTFHTKNKCFYHYNILN